MCRGRCRLVEPVVNDHSSKQMTILGKDMKMKAPVEMMNSMVRKTRLARAVVLLGVGTFLGAQVVNAEVRSVIFTHEKRQSEVIDLPYDMSIGHHPEELQNLPKIKSIQKVELSKGEFIVIKQILSRDKMPDAPEKIEVPDAKGYKEVKINQGGPVLSCTINEFSFDMRKGDMIAGPAELFINFENIYSFHLSLSNNSANNKVSVNHGERAALVTLEFGKTSSESTSSTGQKALVLPKGSGVNELVLESSEDLVNWEKDTLGDKNTDSGNRFYRLRAVKK